MFSKNVKNEVHCVSLTTCTKLQKERNVIELLNTTAIDSDAENYVRYSRVLSNRTRYKLLSPILFSLVTISCLSTLLVL